MKCFGWHFMRSKPNNEVLCQRRSECTLGSWCFLGRWAHWLKNAWLWKRVSSVHELRCSKCAVWRSLCSSDLLFLMMHHQQGGARRFPHRCFNPYLTAVSHPCLSISHTSISLALSLFSFFLLFFPLFPFPYALPFDPAAKPFSTSGCLFFSISLLSSSHLPLSLC